MEAVEVKKMFLKGYWGIGKDTSRSRRDDRNGDEMLRCSNRSNRSSPMNWCKINPSIGALLASRLQPTDVQHSSGGLVHTGNSDNPPSSSS